MNFESSCNEKITDKPYMRRLAKQKPQKPLRAIRENTSTNLIIQFADLDYPALAVESILN